MVPDSSTMEGITPGEGYSADYATSAKPPVIFPSTLPSYKGLRALRPNWEVQRDCQTVEVVSNRNRKHLERCHDQRCRRVEHNVSRLTVPQVRFGDCGFEQIGRKVACDVRAART